MELYDKGLLVTEELLQSVDMLSSASDCTSESEGGTDSDEV